MGVLENRASIVTGAAKGIRQAVASEFASEGASVAVVDVDGEGAKATAAQLAAAGARTLAMRADVSDEHAVRSMVEEVAEHFGHIDILVNNAGIYPRYVWNEMSAEQWDRIQGVNLRSCFLCSQAVFAYLKKQGAGKIINISSVTFWLGFPRNLVHYTASKGGVIGFTRALGARYWG